MNNLKIYPKEKNKVWLSTEKILENEEKCFTIVKSYIRF